MKKEASQPPHYSVVAPATRPLASVYLLATQRTTRARCEGLGVSDAAKIQLFREPARGWNKKLCPTRFWLMFHFGTFEQQAMLLPNLRGWVYNQSSDSGASSSSSSSRFGRVKSLKMSKNEFLL